MLFHTAALTSKLLKNLPQSWVLHMKVDQSLPQLVCCSPALVGTEILMIFVFSLARIWEEPSHTLSFTSTQNEIQPTS